MSTVTDQKSIYGTEQLISWSGQYAGSTGIQEMNLGSVQTAYVVDYNSYAKLTHGFNTYFKMQGFNNTTQKYEVWFSTGTPLLVPPSGNALSHIEIVLTWIDR